MAAGIVDLPVEHAVLLLLYSLGAIAAGCLFSYLFTTITGVCVALFYAVVLTMIATGNAGVALEVAEASGSLHQQRCFEAVLLALGAVIVVEFVRHQVSSARTPARAAAQHGPQAVRKACQSGQAQEQNGAGCSDCSDRCNNSMHAHHHHQHPPPLAGTYSAPIVHTRQATCRQPVLIDFPAAFNRGVGVASSNAPVLTGKDWTPTNSSLAHQDVTKAQAMEVVKHKRPSRLATACTRRGQQWHMPVEQLWCNLPDAVFVEIMQRVAAADIGSIRCVCWQWCDAAGRCLTRLRPSSLPVKDVVEEFPSLKALDLSNCTKDINPQKLAHLKSLAVLEELTLGCHHRLIASTVTDTCLAEVAQLTTLHTLNLSQCVHVGDSGMMSLLYLPSLRSLNISGCVAVTDIGIMMVAQLSQLTSLDMPWCLKITNVGLQALTPLTKLANLNISGCQLITEQGIACLAAFPGLEKLSLLNLGYSKVCVTDAAVARLSGLTKLRSLNIGSMQLCNKMVTDEGMRLISSNFKGLTQLGLMSLDISDAGVALLAQLDNLQALNLRGCTRVSSGCLKYLSTLTRVTDLCLLHNPQLEVNDACLTSLAVLPNLQILGLGNFQVNATASDTCLVPLSNARQLLVLSIAFFTGRFGPETCSMISRMTALQHLDLQGSQHANADLLQSVGQLTGLQSLHLSRCARIDDASLQHISQLSQLHTLNISNCFRVTDVGLAALAKLHNLTHLLAQQCTDVTDAGVAQLGRLTKLKVLDLSLCERITGCGFQAFGRCKQMATLSLNGCSSLNDGGLRAIGQLISLTKLDLSNCQLISDTGVSYLRGLCELTGLDLALCIRVGDAALAAIASSMKQLATLKVNGCMRITDAGVNEVCNIPSLLTLHLDRCIHLTDYGLQCLTRLSGLTSLRISRCPNVTDVGVASLSRLSRLSTLSLAQCPQVTDVGLLALAPLTTLASLEF